MSQKIDPKEVLVYLNELGYTNITAQQLKEFIIDLKKLLKYDLRFGGFPDITNKEQSCCLEETEYCPNESCEGENDTDDFDKENVKETSRKSQKEDADKVSPKEQHIAVHIYDTKNQNKTVHDHCIHINKLNESHKTTDSNKLKLVPNTVSIGFSKGETGTESTMRSTRPSSTREYSRTCPSRASSKDKKSKLTFIRPATSRPSFNKSDPVALYHYYQSEWKRTKIPGQDNRDDLRWAIRERMLSGPRVEVKSRCNVQRCGWR